MLRTNLSTRPFYNERAVRTALGALAALAVALTLFNTYEILRLRGQSRDSRQAIVQNDAQAREMRQKAEVIRRSMDKEKLAAVQAAAHEANVLIDRRTFSWTELLNLFQETLPPDVRISGVMPQMDSEGRRLVQISVFSKRTEDLEEFMDALEKTTTFSGVLPRSEQVDESGTLRSELQAYYTPAPPDAAPPSAEQAAKPPAASEPDKAAPGKQSAAGSASPGVVR